MAVTANVWTSGQAIMYYQELRGKVLKNLEYKSNVNWRKLYDENRSNPQRLIQELLKDDIHERKPTISKGIPKITGLRKQRILKNPGQGKLKGDKKTKGVTFKDPSSSSSMILSPTTSQTYSNPTSNSRADANTNMALANTTLGDADDFDLGFDMNEDSLIVEPSAAWKTADEADASSDRKSQSVSALSQDAGVESSMWKMAQMETSQRQKQEEMLRQQQEQDQRKLHQQRQAQLLQQQQQHQVNSSQGVHEIARESSQREMQEKLQKEREAERKRREEEAKQLQDEITLDDM
jgi:hypothetical protein